MAPIISLLASLALSGSALSLALPPNIHQRPHRAVPVDNSTQNVPTSATVSWYQDAHDATNTTCGLKVSEGTINTTTCYTLHTEALGIQQNPGFDCVFKMWSGVSDCSGNGSWTETVIPSGNATTCINDHVLDGGSFTHMSGTFSC